MLVEEGLNQEFFEKNPMPVQFDKPTPSYVLEDIKKELIKVKRKIYFQLIYLDLYLSIIF